MEQSELIPHLFRVEFSKITAVLCRHYGMAHLEAAEDIAAETFAAALETWPHRGVPPNPSAWLYRVARNKARNTLKRDQLFAGKITPELTDNTSTAPEPDWSESNIKDSQLRMLFAVCDPAIAPEAQIALALRILCGFGIEEIANALLTNKETINKRLYRAKEKLRREKTGLIFPDEAEIDSRLATVLTTLYLLFNEGYYSENREEIIREELCLEAMRLVYLLLDYESTRQPAVQALLALMCFHASRFPSRKDTNGAIILYQDQDPSLWNQELIAKGVEYLHRASRGESLSSYHIEATIAYWHTRPEDSDEKWAHVLQLYDHLVDIAYSPVAALNRTFALAKVKGYAAAITEAEELQLTDNPFFYALLGELYRNIDRSQSKSSFQKALALAKTRTDRQLIRDQLHRLESFNP